MLRIGEDFSSWPGFSDFALRHNYDAVAELGGNTQIMRYKQQ